MSVILTLLGSNKKLGNSFNSIPLEWYTPAEPTYSEIVLQPVSDGNVQRNQKLHFALFLLLAVGGVLQGGHHTKYASSEMGIMHDAMEDTLVRMYCVIATACLIILAMLRANVEEYTAFINGLIQYDVLYPRSPKPFRERLMVEQLNVLFVHAILLTKNILPAAFVFLLHWQNPRRATLVGYWLLPGGDNDKGLDTAWTTQMEGIIVQAGVFLVNFWMWSYAITGVALAILMGQCLGCITLLDNLHGFRELCLEGGIAVRKRRRPLSIYKRGAMFRHLQLLAEVMNGFQKGPFILTLLVAITAVSSFSVVALVHSTSTKLTGVMLVLFCDTYLAIFVMFGIMSLVYATSQEIVQVMRGKRTNFISRRGEKWERRFYLSCNPLKVMLSSGTFIDECTPLMCMHISISLAVNMLLLNNL